MQICIIGGGLTGLSAAYALSREHTVQLIEKNTYLGGCLASYNCPGYSIERFYHHCFPTDATLFQLLSELRLSKYLEWWTGTTGYYADSKIYPLNSPLDIIRYPLLSTTDKAKLAWLTLRAKGIDARGLDDIPAREYILEHLGKGPYESFFEPLLKSKFGEKSGDVSAAWLISRIAIRSHRGMSGERLGYLRGGFQTLITALESALMRNGCAIRKGTPAISLSYSNGTWYVNETRYDAVLSTISPQEVRRLGGPAIIGPLYQGAACMTLGLDHDVAEGIYWINMKDPAPYGAIISHTNFIPFRRYGEYIVYLASYFSGAPPRDLEERMLSDFRYRFNVEKAAVHWHHLAIDPWAGPIYATGSRRLIPPYEQKGLFIAGMFSEPNYPERSMEGSIRSGFEVAIRIAVRESA